MESDVKSKDMNLHEHARMAIACGEEASAVEQAWLREHLASCAPCREFAESTGAAIRQLRAVPMMAGASLVSTTQLRVRQRAHELQRHRERLWVISICCAAVALCTAISTLALWQGFVWMGIGSRTEWATPGFNLLSLGYVTLGLMPAVLAGFLLLGHGTHMSDHDENSEGRGF